MAIEHGKPGEIVDVKPLGARVSDSRTTTLIKTDALEVIRLVLPAGKEIPPHEVRGEITVHCLEGKVGFQSKHSESALEAGELVYLASADQHSLRAIEDSSLLVTILLQHKSS